MDEEPGRGPGSSCFKADDDIFLYLHLISQGLIDAPNP